MRRPFGISAILIAMILIISGCGSSKAEVGIEDPPTTAPDREYTDLSTLPDNSIKGPQEIDIKSYTLRVFGEVEKETIYTYGEIVAKGGVERYSILYCVEGWDAKVLWVGTKIMDLLAPATIKDGSTILIFHSADGYTTSLPLKEIIEKDMIIAYRANNDVLPVSMGYPLIVVAEDKLGYKWARWVTGIEVSSDTGYLGYWEEKGFSNEAEIKDP